MKLTNDVPSAKSDAVDLADWLELEALKASNRTSSYSELASQISLSGSTDVLIDENGYGPDDDGGGEYSSEVADRAWAEIESRRDFCGESFYPFSVTSGAITLKKNGDQSPYVFQLLLSKFGLKAGPKGTYGERIFEHMSAVAGLKYLGGESNAALTYRFGFPRPDRTGFQKALSELCKKLRSGKPKQPNLLMGQQQDSHLDIVVWRSFPDRRNGLLIGFGQCATGTNWGTKLQELQPENFLAEWMDDRFFPVPFRMFYLPFCVEHYRWDHVAIHSGVVFDRCRIAHLVGDLPNDLAAQCQIWASHVISRLKN